MARGEQSAADRRDSRRHKGAKGVEPPAAACYVASMPGWLSRLFGRSPGPPLAELPAAVPEWASALVEAVPKIARAQARLGLQLEGLEGKLDALSAQLGGLAGELRSARAAAAPASPEDGLSPVKELADALDLLEEARRFAGEASPSLATGLGAVLERLERQLASAGVQRLAVPPTPLDGRLFRVVGEEAIPELGDGEVSRVLRAALLHGDLVLREGELLINRRREG
jgi:molecular chaperone GrpE (heat shock protein)